MGLAFLVAAALGLLVYAFVKRSPLRPEPPVSNGLMPDLGGDPRAGHAPSAGKSNKLLSTLGHASDEFFEMGKYLIFGAMLTGIIQAVVTRESLAAIGQGEVSSHLFMMGFAYILSLCSTSDAFVASSFATTFTAGSLLSFLVFGPMIDLKNTLMLLSVFRVRFVLILTVVLAAAVLVGSRLIELAFL
jgi:uncharacterized membrane protein YraQ (UPF0718 family)